MPITPNYDGIWEAVQNTEYVSVVNVAPDGTTTTYGGVLALGRAIRQAVSDVGGAQMTPATTTWHLRAACLPASVVPDRGWRIISVSGRMQGTWVIKEADIVTAGTRYECRCQRLLD